MIYRARGSRMVSEKDARFIVVEEGAISARRARDLHTRLSGALVVAAFFCGLVGGIAMRSVGLAVTLPVIFSVFTLLIMAVGNDMLEMKLHHRRRESRRQQEKMCNYLSVVHHRYR